MASGRALVLGKNLRTVVALRQCKLRKLRKTSWTGCALTGTRHSMASKHTKSDLDWEALTTNTRSRTTFGVDTRCASKLRAHPRRPHPAREAQEAGAAGIGAVQDFPLT